MSELPKDWKMGTLRDLARVRNGYAFKSSDFIDEGVPLIRQSNLVGDTVEIENAKCLPPSFLDEHPRFTVKKGDVLIGMSGSIGKLSWYRHDTPALQNQRTGLLEFEEPGSAGWVCYFLNSVERQLNQTAKGVAVQNISGKEIEALSLPLPSLSEQRRIVARIEELFSRLDAGVEAGEEFLNPGDDAALLGEGWERQTKRFDFLSTDVLHSDTLRGLVELPFHRIQEIADPPRRTGLFKFKKTSSLILQRRCVVSIPRKLSNRAGHSDQHVALLNSEAGMFIEE